MSRSPGRLLTRQAAAGVGVGTYWAWEPLYIAVSSAALQCPQREERVGEYRGGRPPTACFTQVSLQLNQDFQYTTLFVYKNKFLFCFCLLSLHFFTLIF